MLQRHIEFLKEKVFQSWGRHIFYAFLVLAALLIIFVSLHAALFGPPGTDTTRENLIVQPDETLEEIAADLEAKGFVRHAFVFRFAYTVARTDDSIRPGGYELARDMDAWTVAATLGRAPYLSWITIPSGVRKEEIAEILTESLGWTRAQHDEWLAATETSADLTEGVYFPDTYLIPSDQPPAQIAARLRGRFEEAFAPYATIAADKDIPWTDVVNLAALVEKEAAKNDKALVAGILWNRINKNMKLQVDATLQYMVGSEEDWWPTPNVDDKTSTSTFNTYKYEGLPPHPIANPSLESIAAVLAPQKTACLYYLHDSRGVIHCSTNYKAHVANVNRYLK
ncbi:MAG TPA: endolytic transglycosylase MltG [Candidatus Paceibacterota bacterium]|nr:endolytic transglycosylase MltG [Candidatus Paceibacterota bacterium]